MDIESTTKIIRAQQFVGRQVIWEVLNETGIFFFPWNPACFLTMCSDKYVIVSTGSGYVATKSTSQGASAKGGI